MTFSQWQNINREEMATVSGRCKSAYEAGAENAYPALATVCAERNTLQVEVIKLRKALKEIGDLFEVGK